MSTKQWLQACPYGKGSSMNAIYAVLARANGKPLAMKEIAKRSKQKASTTLNMVSAMRSRFHGSSLARAGVEVARVEDGYVLQQREPDPSAKRPAPKKPKAEKKKK